MSLTDHLAEIIQLYDAGKTQQEIANIIGCTQTSISYMLRKNGIKCRNRKDVFKNQKYFDINTSFFDKIDSEKSAYFLGFLYADGCVQTNNNSYMVTLKLKSEDKIILEKFRDIISPSSSVKITNKKYAYVRVNQKEIYNQLISHGCIPNKSLTLDFPTTVPQELLHHFVRGYSDGDGTIYQNTFRNKKTVNTIWKIVSTKQFCEQVALLLKKELNISCFQSLSRPKTNNITTILSVGGNIQVEKVLDWLYKDATIYLPRKFDKYLEFKKSRC